METITSKQNSQIKQLRELAQKKNRQSAGLFTVENLAIIYDALVGGHDFVSLFVTQDFIDRHPDKFSYLQGNSHSKNFYIISDEVNKHFSQLDTPSGITAVYQIRQDSFREGGSAVYLDNINDPGNVGTIMRTCLAFGFDNVVLSENCADIYNAKTVSAAKDSIFKLNVSRDLAGRWIDNCTLPVYIADSNQGISLDRFEPADRFCLVMGSESHGVSPEISRLADKSLKIDIDESIESLNVATAAAILLYKLSRK